MFIFLAYVLKCQVSISLNKRIVASNRNENTEKYDRPSTHAYSHDVDHSFSSMLITHSHRC